MVLLGSEETEGVDGHGKDLVDNGDDALRVIVGDWAGRSLHKRSSAGENDNGVEITDRDISGGKTEGGDQSLSSSCNGLWEL